MLNSSPQDDDLFGSARQGFNVVMLVVETYAFAVEVLLHHRFGVRAFGIPACCVLLLIPFHASAWEHHDVNLLLSYWWVYLLLCLLHRIGMSIRHCRGTLLDEHSRYQGWPWVMHLYPNCSEATVKRGLEPFMVCLAAIGFAKHDPPVASFLAIAAFCLLIKHTAAASSNREQELDLNDQVHEMQQQGERLRRVRR